MTRFPLFTKNTDDSFANNPQLLLNKQNQIFTSLKNAAYLAEKKLNVHTNENFDHLMQELSKPDFSPTASPAGYSN